jgi:hypothetical protein
MQPAITNKMRTFIFLLTLLSTSAASAGDATRCGTDSFGNTVCMDKDGVLTNLSRDAASDYKVQSASGVAAADKKRREEISEKLRCGTDPFGNKVCR